MLYHNQYIFGFIWKAVNVEFNTKTLFDFA